MSRNAYNGRERAAVLVVAVLMAVILAALAFWRSDPVQLSDDQLKAAADSMQIEDYDANFPKDSVNAVRRQRRDRHKSSKKSQKKSQRTPVSTHPRDYMLTPDEETPGATSNHVQTSE